MEAHFMIIENNISLVSPLSRDSFSRSHGHLYRWGIRVSVPHCSHGWSISHLQFGVEKTAGRGPEKFTAASSSELVVQDYAEEAIIDGQVAAVIVIDKAKFLELIHKMTDSRPSGANHL